MNVARWTAERIWSEVGLVPGHAELSAYLKHDERYADLHSQSSQRVIQELAAGVHLVERPSTSWERAYEPTRLP